MIYRFRILIIILAAIVSTTFASVSGTFDPNTDCPKKKKQEGDSISINSEKQVLEDIPLQEIPTRQAVTRKAPDKANNDSFITNIDESNKGMDREPNSAMSFNFIYYIIDKFKFTDPME